MKNEFMSPMCSLKMEHLSDAFLFGKTGNKSRKMEREKAEEFLQSLKEYGIEGEDDRALDVITAIGKKDFLSFAKPYSYKNVLGELVFVPGICLSRVIDDILFNNELCFNLSLSLSFFRKGLEPKISANIIQWAETNQWNGIVSEFGVNYMDKGELASANFESIWMDYDMVFQRGMAEAIAMEYGMDAFHFSQWLNMAAYVTGLAGDGRKILDHVFQDKMECPDNLKRLFPLWNKSENKIGNLILALDYLNQVEENHWDISLEKKVWELLRKYTISPERVGFKCIDEKTSIQFASLCNTVS